MTGRADESGPTSLTVRQSLPGSKPLFAACLIITILCVSRFLPVINLEFDGGHESMLDGRYYAGIQRGWLEDGVAATSWRPILTPEPSTPVTGRVYANHPPLAHYTLRLFVKAIGFREAAFRIMGLVFTVLGALATCLVVGRARNHVAAAFAGLVFLALPVTLHHGMAASYAPMILLFGLVAMSAIPHAGQSCGRWFLILPTLALAAYTDWAALFYLPGCLLFARLRGLKVLKSGLLCTAAIGTGFTLWVIQLSLWEGGIGEAVELLKSAGGNAAHLEAFNYPGFGATLWRAQQTTLAWSGLVLAAGGSLWSLYRWGRGRLDALDAFTLAFLVAGILKTLAFPIQAYHHDFWAYSLVVCAALSGARFLSAVWSKNKTVACLLAAAVLWQGNKVAFDRVESEYQDRTSPIAAAINKTFDRNTLVLLASDMSPLSFYLEGWSIDSIRSADQVQSFYWRWQKGEFPQERFALIAPLAFEQQINASGRWQVPADMSRVEVNGTVFTWLDRR